MTSKYLQNSNMSYQHNVVTWQRADIGISFPWETARRTAWLKSCVKHTAAQEFERSLSDFGLLLAVCPLRTRCAAACSSAEMTHVGSEPERSYGPQSMIREPAGFCRSCCVVCKGALIFTSTEHNGMILQRVFAMQLNVSYLAWDSPWENVLRACGLICKRGKCCNVCVIQGTGHFLEFFALQKKPVKRPHSGSGSPCSHQPKEHVQNTCTLCQFMYFKRVLSTGIFSSVPKSSAKR